MNPTLHPALTLFLAGSSLMAGAGSAVAQTVPTFPPTVTARTAAEGLQFLLDKNVDPGGPLRGDGATIAGIVVGQSLTFPISSSSGAFAVRPLTTVAPSVVDVSMSGSFGSLFAERADTNGRGAFSLGFNYQRKRWGSLAGISLTGYDLTLREVFRNDIPGLGPAGTTDDFEATIDYRTDVLVIAANYGVLSWLDAGVSVPWIDASVDGLKRRVMRQPGELPSTVVDQRVIGRSKGLGDLILRVKARVLPDGARGTQPPLDTEKRASGRAVKVAAGLDLRLPTGATAELFLDCKTPPNCPGAQIADVPDLGLGAVTWKLLGVVSGDIRRLSPYVNVSYLIVPSYPCDDRFSTTGRCKGAVFVIDPITGGADAKNQNLSDEFSTTVGATYQVVPYRATVSFDMIGRRLINAGQFYRGKAQVHEFPQLNRSVSTEIENRPGHVDTFVGVAGVKVGFNKRWVAVGSFLFPMNRQGLQPAPTWLVGLERAIGR